MVVDEELKMMCDICHEGGQVLGPFLKPMTHLVHTEYLLAGRTRSDVRDVLRDTMFAATVTGAPVENACRLIHEYESEGRGYYAGALALIGRDEEGAPTADSPIVIRTADVSPDGAMKVTAGATLVRDSKPDVRGGRDAGQGRRHPLGVRAGPGRDGYADRTIADLTQDEDVLIALNSRNQRLAKFWLTDQAGAPPAPTLAGRTIAILHGEDDFVNMLAHVFSVLGMGSRVVRHEAVLGTEPRASSTTSTSSSSGPGPVTRASTTTRRSRPTTRRSTRCSSPASRSSRCAWATRCSATGSGSPLPTRTSSSRAPSRRCRSTGGAERVGFYNTFVGARGRATTSRPA